MQSHPPYSGRRTTYRRNRQGQTLVEYALIVALISVVAVATLWAMGGQVKGVYGTVNRQLAVSGTGGAQATPPPPR